MEFLAIKKLVQSNSSRQNNKKLKQNSRKKNIWTRNEEEENENFLPYHIKLNKVFYKHSNIQNLKLLSRQNIIAYKIVDKLQ